MEESKEIPNEPAPTDQEPTIKVKEVEEINSNINENTILYRKRIAIENITNKYYEPRISPKWVQVLINLRMKYAKQFTRKRHSAASAWMMIYDEMLELGAPTYITVDKIKKKWMNLIARYKHFKFIVNANKDPNDKISWPFYDHIDRAYAKNPSIIELRKMNGSRYLNKNVHAVKVTHKNNEDELLSSSGMETNTNCNKTALDVQSTQTNPLDLSRNSLQLQNLSNACLSNEKLSNVRNDRIEKNDRIDSDTESSESVPSLPDTMMRRQQFTSTLIQLRCDYKHLFTGKKYAAQRGWMIVKDMHPDGAHYTVDQFSKCWQNLTQRYRALNDLGKDHAKINWLHYEAMHKALQSLETDSATTSPTPEKSASPTAQVNSTVEIKHEQIEEKSSDFFDEEEDHVTSQENCADEPEIKRRRRGADDAVDELLKYLIRRDIRLDEQHNEFMQVLQEISNKLDR